MDPSFGARLRAHRERQQVALSAISEETKIKVSMLEALERDDVSQWPEGIFRRAYVRAYARAIGLDPETLVREFLDVHPDPIVSPSDTETELENPQWPAGFRRVVTSAMAAVPSRRRRIERDTAEPVQPELNLPRAVGDCRVDEPVSPESALPAVADGDDHAEANESIGHPSDDGERRPALSLLAAANLCTRLGRIPDRREVAPILEDTVMALDAVGLIVWFWDSRAAVLRPSLAHGYTDVVLERMSRVRADADNAIAAAFRSGRACVVNGSGGVTGAVAVPLLAPSGCVGVLAVELRHGDEQRECVRSFAAILAAQLVTLVGSTPLAEAVSA